MINSNWVRMAAWRESFGETSNDVETKIDGGVGETRGIINYEFKREIGNELGGKIEGEIGVEVQGEL